MADLNEKTVLITGASRGIGAAAAREFAAAGAKVALAARTEAAVTALAEELGGLALPCDVSRAEDMEAAVARTVENFGRLDVLVNNAGVVEPIAMLAEADPVAWGATIDINIKGVFHGMRAALPVMVQQGAGTILTVGSGAAYNALEGWSAYCTSKAGAIMLTRAADLEYRSRGLRILSLSPGTVATDMQATIRDSGINRVSQLDWSAHVPPEWPARALVWMCGKSADGYLGGEVSLREDAIRRQIGLIA